MPMIIADKAKKHSFSRLALYFFIVFIVPGRLVAAELITKGERLTLNKGIEIAIKMHPQIQAAQNSVDIVKSRIGQAKAGYFPQINLSAGMRRNSSPLLSDPYTQYSQNLSL